MAKILVTGGTGFIGNELVKELSKRHEVTVFDRTIKHVTKGVKYIKGDITDIRSVKKYVKGRDFVYHLAAVLDESLPKKEIFDINVGGTISVLEACKENNIKRLIYLSTVGVMGEVNGRADEKWPYNPQTNYEKSKAMAERTVLEYYKRYKLPVIIIRSALVYGANKYTLKILEKAKKPFPIIGSGKNKFHVVYVKNLIDALVKSMKNGKDGSIYIIADDDAHTYEEFYKIIREELGVDKEPSHIPVWFANFIAFLYKMSGRKSIVTKEHINRLIRNRWYRITKAKRYLKYKPKYDLRKGIKETIKYFKSQGFLE
ncbi:MAG: NAD-dependent epimerase/dehydratase family protein [Candidatus Aenigmarchaeota archaeon]|nr:NAD-dependent epimerase/dehydratase family protein [Candidatus Aenigmarchaeota archaeon]